jgi:hypothetical protein
MLKIENNMHGELLNGKMAMSMPEKLRTTYPMEKDILNLKAIKNLMEVNLKMENFMGKELCSDMIKVVNHVVNSKEVYLKMASLLNMEKFK